MSAIITLTTDFGLGSPYVAAMKGVMLSINPEARLVDISHAVGPQNVRQGALVLAEATTWFPAGTIHVGVVDPGVGTQRRIVYARIGDQQYIAPDNGLLSRLTLKTRPSQIITVENPEHWLPSVSNTFHGRDIMAPVAAQLSLGMEPDRLGPPRAELVELDWPQPRIESNAIVGEVIWIDGFGNLISNITGGNVDRDPGLYDARPSALRDIRSAASTAPTAIVRRTRSWRSSAPADILKWRSPAAVLRQRCDASPGAVTVALVSGAPSALQADAANQARRFPDF